MDRDQVFDLLKDGTAVDRKYRYIDKIGDQQDHKIKQRDYVIDALCSDKNDWPAVRLAAGLIACTTKHPCNQPAAYASDPLASSSGFGRRLFGPVPSI